MSADDDGGDGGPGEREVAYRLFAAEFEDASLEYSESDEDRAPNYVVTPTGARVNRLFVAGVLTEVETVNENTLRGRVVDPTGAFVTYAGQYQPDEVAFLDRASPPAFVSLTGKARTFQPDDSDVVYTSVRPERLSEVTADTRDDWAVDAAEATLRRVAVVAAALEMDERGDALHDRLVAAGVDDSLATGVPLALDHYGTTETYLEGLRAVAREALAVVADERQEVSATTPAPDADDGATLGPLPDEFGLGDTVTSLSTPETDAVTEPGDDVDTATDTADATETTEATDATETTETTDATEATEVTDATEATPTAETTNRTETATESSSGGTSDEPATSTDDTAVTDTGGSTTTELGDESSGFDDTDEPTAESDDGLGSPTETDDELGGFDDSGSPTETDDELGGFDDSGSPTETDDELGGFDDSGESEATDPEDFDEDDLDDALTDEEREEVLSEHDVGFSSGTEVPDPEESDLDAPDPEEITPTDSADADAATDDTASTDGDVEASTPSSSAPTGESGQPASEPSASSESSGDPADVDLESTVVEIMDELDGGGGADREEVMAVAVDRHGVTPDAAEEAIQEALMSGQCYEAGDGLKSI
ncbi:hypothetical protein [Halobaculum sp. MBLA0143]|uniref:hypothetical protein n=1 Tax=Halobaculum sp. MBLA0143 TaxID=3079933 RepID=UPI00352694E6